LQRFHDSRSEHQFCYHGKCPGEALPTTQLREQTNALFETSTGRSSAGVEGRVDNSDSCSRLKI
jgi:hypothetical protein